MQKAGGLWDPGGRRWLIGPQRMGPLIRSLRRSTDPLFRQAGMATISGPRMRTGTQ